MPSELWQAGVLGVVQGLTGFLPISSTGHLILVPALFGWQDSILNDLEFDVALHIGTLGALLAVYWRDWAALARAALTALRDRSLADPLARLAWLLVVGTIPAALAGALFERQIEESLRFLLGYLRHRSLLPFVIYRVAAGALVLALAAAGRI